LNSSLPNAAANARAPDSRGQAPARESRDRDREAGGEESLSAHAKRVIVATERHALVAILDPIIGFFTRLRKAVGGEEGEDGSGGNAKHGSRDDRRPGGRHDAEANPEGAEVQVPQPVNRLRRFLIYTSVLLLGGMGGGALAYELLYGLLNRQFAESRKLEATVSKHVKTIASSKKALEDVKVKNAEAEKALAEAKAKRAEAEKKLESAAADYEKSSADKQKKLAEIESKVKDVLQAERQKTKVPSPPPGRDSGSANSGAKPNSSAGANLAASSAAKGPSAGKAGDCEMDGKNVAALKDCIKEFYR